MTTVPHPARKELKVATKTDNRYGDVERLTPEEIRSRIVEVRKIPFSSVSHNPQNVRIHPANQRSAFREAVRTIGFASVPLAYTSERNGGVLTWVDGNLRGDEVDDYEGDVAILDIDDKEADLLMVTLDPIAALAMTDVDKLQEVLDGLDVDNDVLNSLIADLVATDGLAGLIPPPPARGSGLSSAGQYSRKIEAPIYEIKGDKPAVEDLYDDSKTAALVKDILKANLPADVTSFLIYAAQRHTSFRFDRIAEYYAHADPDLQRLMEASALIVIDFEKAIEYGFVQMVKEFQAQHQSEIDRFGEYNSDADADFDLDPEADGGYMIEGEEEDEDADAS